VTEQAGSQGSTRGLVVRALFVRARLVLVFLATLLVAASWDSLRDRWEGWTSHRRATALEAREFFCPMHPLVVRSEPGACPLCGMPLSGRAATPASSAPLGAARLVLSGRRVAQAGVETSLVRREPLEVQLDLVGTVELDEHRSAHVVSRVAGRVERVFTPSPGAKVNRGDPLAWVFNRSVATLLEERRVHEATLTQLEGAAVVDRARIAAVREQIASVEERLRAEGALPDLVQGRAPTGEHAASVPGDRITSVEERSPLAGTLISMSACEGQYVAEGAELFMVADTSWMWFVAHVSPEDAALLVLGPAGWIVPQQSPGERLPAIVSFVDPAVDPVSRTVRIVFEVPNTGGRLFAGGLATASVSVPLSGVDVGPPRVVPPRTTSYMGCDACPEVVEVAPGSCPRCGMPLRERPVPPGMRLVFACPVHPTPTSDLPVACKLCGLRERPKLVPEVPTQPRRWGCFGVHRTYLSSEPGSCPVCSRELAAVHLRPVLAVPVSAVIDTGTHKLVYRESAPGVFDAVLVTTGRRAGDLYPVLSGLSEGERVVTSGAFLVDAETRLDPGAASAYKGASTGPEKPAGAR